MSDTQTRPPRPPLSRPTTPVSPTRSAVPREAPPPAGLTPETPAWTHFEDAPGPWLLPDTGAGGPQYDSDSDGATGPDPGLPVAGGPASPGLPAAGAPGPGGNSELPEVFGPNERELDGLIQEQARWHKPERLVVDRTERVGLEIGDSDELTSTIRALLPSSESIPAGDVRIGPLTRARLIADTNDADITPSESVDASTSQDVALLWTWFIRPKRPTDSLLLTVHIEVPTRNGAVFVTDMPLELRVERTLAYTSAQIFANWTTWAGIIASVAGGARLIWLQRGRMKRTEKPTGERMSRSASTGQSPGGTSSTSPPGETVKADVSAEENQGVDSPPPRPPE